jgi:HPt (histidine-containing phosphotransfer) domain-containing protein
MTDRLVVPGDEVPAGAAAQDQMKPLGSHPLPEKPVTSRLASSPRFQKVIVQFIDKLKAELIRAQSALESENLEELALIAHWLKGAGGTVGFDDFTEPAAKLEKFAKTEQKAQAGQMLQQVQFLSEAIEPPAAAHG